MASAFSVDGVVSGLDTRSIITQLMAIERRPLQQVQRQQDRQQERLKALQTVKTQFTSLTAIVARLAQRSQINLKSATTDTLSTSPVVLNASAESGAANGSYRITVSQLATATRVTSGGPLGQVIDRLATLANGGFRVSPITEIASSPTTFSINGVSISVNNTTTLDDGTANSIIGKINAAGANVTASLIADTDGRANNRVQLVSNPGQALQLGSLGDTSNVLRVLNLSDAVSTGYTASSVAGGAVDAGALNTSITINGVTTAITQADGGFTAQQNAAFIAQQVNAATGHTVRAIDNSNGTFTLEHKTLGSQQSINITAAGTGTGLAISSTRTGTDRAVSTLNLGAANLTEPLTGSRLATAISGLDGSGNGAFSLNGVQVAYRATDSLSDVVNRINASTAGVTATYDSVQDRIRLSALQTGALTISAQDVTGNFLAATGILGTTQALGQHAQFTIDGINGGQPLTSSSNTVTGYVPGVTLNLRSTSSSAVTVTVAQNTQATVDLVRSFVDNFNKTIDTIAAQTKTDPKGATSGALSGDPGLQSIERTLRSTVSSSALGANGIYRSLADIGISSGAVGSAVGSTRRLQIDEAKLTTALKDSPQAVEAIFAASLGSAGAVSGTGNVASVSGSPTGQHESGTYYVKILDAGTGSAEARFVASDGRELMKRTGTLVANSQNSALIPGLKLTVGATLTAGEDSFALTVNARGVMVHMQDQLDNTLGTGKYFETRATSSETISKQLGERVAQMEERLTLREATLSRKFSALEAAMARLQSQGSALTAQLTQRSNQQG